MSSGYVEDDITDERLVEERELYGPFTASVRDLLDATIRTTVDDDEVRAVRAEVEALTARLRARQVEGSYGVRFGRQGRGRPWGNPVIGLRNPIAPPVVVQHTGTEDGRVWADFHLGAAYEGAPGLAHGGIASLVLDHLLGEAAGAAARPGMTATLTLNYRRITPLGDLRAEAWVERFEGHKTWARGQITREGEVTVEAEGLFILPRWARTALDARDEAAPTPSYFE